MTISNRIPGITSKCQRFASGEIVVTSNALSRLDPDDIAQGLARHLAGDWGELCPEDAEANEDGLRNGHRLFSAYGQDDGRFWIITEWDRSVTTILLPEDY